MSSIYLLSHDRLGPMRRCSAVLCELCLHTLQGSVCPFEFTPVKEWDDQTLDSRGNVLPPPG
jgi:hypothetical protein